MNACAHADQDCGWIEEACIPAVGEHPFRIDLFEYCAEIRQDNTLYTSGTRVRPPVPNGFALQATNTGTSGGSPPAFRPKLGALIPDGGLTWQVIAAGTNGMGEVTAPAYEVEEVGSGDLEIDGLDIEEGRYITGIYQPGVAGTTYEVTFSFVLNALTRAFRQRVRVT